MRAMAISRAAGAFVVAVLLLQVRPSGTRLVAGAEPSATPAAAGHTVRALVPARSHASFGVTHLFVQHVSGSVPVRSGQATFADATSTVPMSVEATLDPRRIATGDGDRDDDLQGPDWFDVARFPKWTFAGTANEATPGGFVLQGSMTLHGVARPVTLAVTTLRGFPGARYRATGTVDRHGFGMRITPFDATIGNDVTLSLEVEFE